MAVDQATEAKIVAVEEYIEQWFDSIGGLTEVQKDYIVSLAITLPPTPEGMLDIQTATRRAMSFMWTTSRRQDLRLLVKLGPTKRTRPKGTRKKRGAA